MSSPLGDQCDRVESALERFREEIESAAQSYYLWKEFHNKLATDKAEVAGFQRAPQAWNTIFHSLQATHFIVVGRIFDTNKNAFTLHRIRKICVKNIAAFSREALQKRKGWHDLSDDDFNERIQSQIDYRTWLGEGPGWKRRYIERAYELTEEDLNDLFRSLDQTRGIYEKGPKRVRDEVFAHSNF